MSKKIFLPFVLILFFYSCKKEKAIVDLHYDYFPVKTGTWVIYNVDSIAHNDFTYTVDTFDFQVKEIIESEFADNEGRATQRIERYYRNNADSTWLLRNVWASNRTEKTAERVEENIRYVKLIFPIVNNAKWNGNIANTLDDVSYEYKGIHTAYSLNSIKFDSCLIVQHENELTPYSDKFGEEVYANHIGNIYRKYTNLVKQADGTVTSGHDYSYKAISWGN